MIKKIALIYGLLAIVLVALAGGAAWYFNKPTPVAIDDTIPPTATDCTDELDTRCWQTYRNEEYGFEFKFPAGWEVESDSQYIDGSLYALVFTTYRTPVERLPFLVVREKWSYQNEKEEINDSGSPFTKVIQEGDVTVGGAAGKQLTYSTDIGINFQKTIIQTSDFVFVFDSYENDAHFSKIISTLKFI